MSTTVLIQENRTMDGEREVAITKGIFGDSNAALVVGVIDTMWPS